MNLNQVHSVYFLGVGGIGMSAIARYFIVQGKRVSGYDKTSSELTDQLIDEGIPVQFSDDPKLVPFADLYVYTPAIPENHPVFDHVRGKGGKWYKRSEVLEWITKTNKTIAIAGTHGKTTTTAITAHVLEHCIGNISAFVGGVLSESNKNIIAAESPEYIVVEADEYDRSFLRLHPNILVITSLDADHLDIYGTYAEMLKDYRTLAGRAQKLIIHESIAGLFDHPNKKSYGLSPTCDYHYKNMRVEKGAFVFESNITDISFKITMPGEHNVQNAMAALSIAHSINADKSKMIDALASFKGVKRRFERVFETAGKVIIDDYAHHPEEIKAAIKAARLLYPKHLVAVVFQPHLYSRTRDLEDGFVDSLNQADEVILLPIYPAREMPIEGVSSDNLLNRLSLKTKRMVEKPDLVNAVLSLTAETILILGAGDIDRIVKPIVKAAKEQIQF
ncbi:MAG: UDP-N-acetylmuramate--L-alanine ligase [Salibacteraceae bacterium]